MCLIVFILKYVESDEIALTPSNHSPELLVDLKLKVESLIICFL